jgi:hypothetical protein
MPNAGADRERHADRRLRDGRERNSGDRTIDVEAGVDRAIRQGGKLADCWAHPPLRPFPNLKVFRYLEGKRFLLCMGLFSIFLSS